MKRQEESQQPSQELECERDEMVPINPSRSVIINQTDGLSVEGGMQGLRRAITGTTLADPGPNVSSDSIPSVSEVDATETPLTRARPTLKAWSSADKPRHGSALSSDRSNHIFPLSPRAYNDYLSESRHVRTRKVPSASGEYVTQACGKLNVVNGNKEKNVVELVADAMRELSKIREKEQSLRPLRIERQDKDHQPDDTLKEQFQNLVDDELRLRRLNARDWLRVATWWLLKVPIPFLTDDGGECSRSLCRQSTTCETWKGLKTRIHVVVSASPSKESLRPIKLM